MKIGFVSLGCPKNLVDSEVMMGLVESCGHELTTDPSDADAIVVNTCSFIDPAKQESIDTILEMAEHKKFGRAQRLVVAGCLVERYREELREQVPEVDAVLGTNELEDIVPHCEGTPVEHTTPVEPFLYHDLTPRRRATAPYLAYLKIAEGCDHPCTFCIIPKFRGGFRSRRFESVVREADSLFRSGVREINLIGQDTTSYGDDLGVEGGLAALLDRLGRLEAAGWVRFLYAYPNRVQSRLLETIAEYPALCNYIDIPLQHASPRVLKRMKRGASGNIFLRMIERIRATIPGVGIRTTFIVGFPGETEQDFEELCQFVDAAEFDHAGVFGYSDDETSDSYHLDGKVPAGVIYRRKRRLMALQRKISRRRNRAHVGETSRILIKGPSTETDLLWEGRLETQAEEIDGKTYITEFADGEPKPGDFGEIRITRATDYDLFGRLEKLHASPIPLELEPAAVALPVLQ